VHGIAKNLKSIATSHHDALKEHNIIIDKNKEDAEEARNRLERENKMITKILNAAKDKKSWIAVGVLCAVFIILVIVAFCV